MMLLSPVSNQTRQERDIDFLCTVQYGHPLKETQARDFRCRFFTQLKPVWVDDLGTRNKNIFFKF